MIISHVSGQSKGESNPRTAMAVLGLLHYSLLGAVILLEPACCEIRKVQQIDFAIVINITSEPLKRPDKLKSILISFIQV
jgi:hypothetical protein